MNIRWPRKLPQLSILPILLGAGVFFLVTGGKIFWPTNTDWLMEGDPATHWLGWQFFRYSPILQWPIGANPNYGMDIGSSIVFTDSIPLLAFIFKPLNALLPDTFQYTGLWILICFSLQSFFAWKLLSLFTSDKWLPLIGSVFFTLAPVCLFRLGGHYALFGQWVLLAALYFYLTNNFSMYRWIGLLTITTLIHAYLLAMVMAVWLADLIQRRWLKQISNVKTVNYFLAGIITIAIVMWAAGYFMLGGSIESGGFGFYRMNLLSLIDPDAIWSQLLRDQKGGGGDYEGFNYLGLGMLGLGFIACYEFLRNPKINYGVKIIPISIISIGLLLYAISNHVAIGAHELFSYGLPFVAKPLTSTFRVSGRFFWPVYYVIYLAIFYLLFTRLKNSIAITLCMAMLFIQVIDSTDVWSTFRNKFSHSPAWVSPMRSPVWGDIAHQYKKIIFVLPHNSSANWLPLSQFAATHRIAINTGYFARTNPKIEQAAGAHITASIINNDLSPDSLYVFESDTLWKIASSQIAPSDIAGVLDGFRIVAPNLKNCSTCNTSAITSASVEISKEAKITAATSLPSSPAWINKVHHDVAASCNIDVINGTNLKPGGVTVSVRKGTPLAMEGWAVDRKKQGAQSDAAFELASSDHKQVYIFMGNRSARPDVSSNANYLDLALEIPGLTVAADTREIVAGKYEVSVIMRRGDNEGVSCTFGNAWKIEILGK